MYKHVNVNAHMHGHVIHFEQRKAKKVRQKTDKGSHMPMNLIIAVRPTNMITINIISIIYSMSTMYSISKIQIIVIVCTIT